MTSHRIPIAAIALVLSALLGGLALAADGTVYGKGVAGTEVVKISELLDHPDGYVGKTVRVEGLVTEVCPRRGCWINLASDREFKTLRFKVEDGVIVFPMDAKGKRAVAEGVFTKIELTKEEALQHAKPLHTPLMAVTNAISSVIIVGALLAAAASAGDPEGARA